MQYSEEEHNRMVAAIRPYVGLYPGRDNADYLKFYRDRNLPVHTEMDAKFFAVFAAKENLKSSKARARRMRSDWLYENVPMWRQVSEFTGSDDFLIRPSFRFQGQEFTGSFISPEFRKNSGKKGDKAAKKMKGAEGYHSDEIARAIANKYGGDEASIEQDIIDFFANLKKRDLNKMYSDDKKQRILRNQDMERQAREEWEASRQVKAEEEVIDILEHGRQITEEFPQENPIAFRLLYEKLFPGETVPATPGKIELESINAALAQEAADASTYAQARRDARKASFNEYMEKLAALKEKVMQSKADALKLQRAAAEFAEKNLSPENRGEFTRGILSLLDYSTVPSEKHPEGRRQSEFNKLLESILERGGKARKADAVDRIGEMLESAKVRRNYKGIPTSVLPSEQARVDRIRQIVGMDLAGVGNWIEWNNNELSRLETEGKEDTPEAERLREDNQLLDVFGALAHKEPGKAEEAEKILKGIIRGGRMAFKGKLEERKAAVQDMRYRAIHEITFGRDTTGREEAKKHSRLVLLNESLGTLLRIVSGQNIGTFDESQAGKMYRDVEDSTQKEQTALRKMQTDLDGAMRDFAGVKGLFSKGKFFRMIGKTEEKSGVFVTQYTRAVPQGENVVFEEGRRQTVTKGIPVEDIDGRKGARSLLAEIDSGKEVTSWNGIPLDEVSIEFLRKQVADFDSGLKQSYEIFSEESDDAQFNRMIEEERKSGRVVLFGHDPKETSRRVEVPLSQAAALQILLTWEQGDYKANMKWNGWNEESIGQLKAFIKPEVQKLGYWMRDYIAKNKPALDEKVYDRYGARLPVNENYFPASFKGGAGRKITGDGAFGKGAGQMSINPGFLIARKFHLKPVDMDSDAFSNFMANQLEQSHFLAWSDSVRDLKSVYGNQQVQNAIKNQFGGDVVTELVDRIDAIARGGGKFSTDQAQKLFGKFYRYWVPAKIALNAGSVMKQVFGMSAYMNQIPVKDFCANLAKANYANPDFREFVKWAKETDYVKNRLSGGLDKDLQYMLNYTRDSEAYSPWSDALLNYGTMPTRWADLYSTLHGGYTVYRYHLEKAKKAGMDPGAAHEEAARAWMRATDETQQSGYLKDQNYFQANQGLYRYLTMFMTNPIQVMNLQLQTVNELRYGSDKMAAGKKLMKQVFVNHFVLPSLMCLANDLLRRGLNFEDYEFEDYATGWALGQFESFFLFGKLGSSLLNFAADKAAGRSTYGQNYFSSLPLADDLSNGISFLFRELKDDEITEKDILDGIKVAGDFGIAGGVLDSRVGAVGGILSALGTQAKRFYRMFSADESRGNK